MDYVKKCIHMVLTVLVFCHLIHAEALCKFEGIFPSQEEEKGFPSTEVTFSTRPVLCPTNMEYRICSCQATCEDPYNEEGCYVCTEEKMCVCPNGFFIKGDECVREEDCNCFLDGYGVVEEGGIIVHSDCSRCSCNNRELICENQCSANASCRNEQGKYQCVCNDGFVGDGQNCNVVGSDCFDLYNAGITTDGVYTIYPSGWADSGFEVYCEMSSNGGGWTVFQRRVNGTCSFYRNWASYKQGFGSLTHEFWLGNDKMHILTHQRSYQLRIDVINDSGTSIYILYRNFSINDEQDNYRLTIGASSGNTVGNPMTWNDGQPFSTFDKDNDDTQTFNCALEHRGAWWYKFVENDHYYRCFKWPFGTAYGFCGDSNLNGDYGQSGFQGVFFWYTFEDELDCNITQTRMKIRPF